MSAGEAVVLFTPVEQCSERIETLDHRASCGKMGPFRRQEDRWRVGRLFQTADGVIHTGCQVR